MLASPNQDSIKALLSGSAVTLLTKIIGLIFSFVLYFALTRLLTVSDFGLYSTITSCAILASIVAIFGMDKLLVRFLAESMHQNKPNEAIGVIRWSYFVTTMICILIILIAFFYFNRNPKSNTLYLYSIPLVIGVAFTVLTQGVFRAKRLIIWAVAPDQVARAAFTLTAISLIFYSENNLTVVGAVLAHGFSSIVIMAFSFYKLSSIYSHELASLPAKYESRIWFKSALPVAWSNLMVLGEIQLVVILAGIFVSLEEVGILTLALRLAAVGSLAMVATNLYVSPDLARLFQQNNKSQMVLTLRRASRLSSITIFPITLFLILFGEQILSAFGDDYIAGFLPLIVLICARNISALFGPVGNLLTQSKCEKQVALTYTFSIILMALLSIWLAPMLGALGMSLAVLVSTIFRSIVNWFTAWRKLKVSSFVF